MLAAVSPRPLVDAGTAGERDAPDRRLVPILGVVFATMTTGLGLAHRWTLFTFFGCAPLAWAVVGWLARQHSTQVRQSFKCSTAQPSAAILMAYDSLTARVAAENDAIDSFDARVTFGFGLIGAAVLAYAANARQLDWLWQRLLIGGLLLFMLMLIADTMLVGRFRTVKGDARKLEPLARFADVDALRERLHDSDVSDGELEYIATCLREDKDGSFTADQLKVLLIPLLQDELGSAHLIHAIKRRLFGALLVVVSVLVLVVLVVANPL
jgi:hypothetical protein